MTMSSRPAPLHPSSGDQGLSYDHNRFLPSTSNWRSWAVVQLDLLDLPPNTTTADIQFNFMGHGNLSRIAIIEAASGRQASKAEITFKPPPAKDFWIVERYRFRTAADKKDHTIRVRFSPHQKKNFTVQSEVREVSYPEESVLPGKSLGFGILGTKKDFTIFSTVTARSESLQPASQYIPKLVVNLRRREIEVHFPILLASANGSRTRQYRFPVSFDDNFKIWKLYDAAKQSTSYIIHVHNPPWYSRRLETLLSASHTKDARLWHEDDLWTRQTDIVEHKETFGIINKTPVAIKKNLNRINIARWTTFKLELDVANQDPSRIKMVESALQDFNVHIDDDTTGFKIIEAQGRDVAPYWTDIEYAGDPNNFMEVGCILPSELRYQLEVCISNGWLSEYAVDKAFLRRLNELPEVKAKQMLTHVDSYAEEIRDPMTIFSDIRFQKPVRARQLPKNCVLVYHATVTATGLKVHTPTVDVSNRVIRKYSQFADRFLRVKFEDDEYRGQCRIFSTSNKKMQLVIDRVGRALSSGIVIAGVHYEFLAYGNSQLREHGAYFFASNSQLSASMIRAEMGAFDNEKIVAKRAARMGQCFSTTHPILCKIPTITKDNLIPDITFNGYTFTDGVGKISPLVAAMVQSSLGVQGQMPSCYQFRLGGCKGILVVDPSLSGQTVQIRPSQFKFESKSQELEVIRYSQFWQPFLNRQLIIVLSYLGVHNETFLQMQKAAIGALSKAMKDDGAALTALRTHVDPNQMTLSMCDLITSGFRRVSEPFVMSLLHLWRAWSLKALKDKAKIPVKDGAFVLGSVDETNTLRGHFDELQSAQGTDNREKEKTLPEIFLQITDPVTGKRKIIEGICVIARNPSLHPGDIRVVKAVNCEALRHICDVVIMPRNGDRDLPSMCSGGDLDGDDYWVIWDKRLIPKIWNVEPFHYEPPTPVTAKGEITTQHIIDFFLHYLMNDQLGRIAHAHLAAADYLDESVNSEVCLELTQLHSTSVDYPKTGVPAELPRRLERNKWPHFMEKKKKPYHSYKILGQLYDDVKKSVKRFGFTARYNLKFDRRIMALDRPDDSYFEQVEHLKHDYDMALQRIMAQHKIQTEFEVWSTFVIDHSKRSQDYKFHEEIGRISKSLKDEYRAELVKRAGGSDFDLLMPYAIAAYQLTAEQVTAALSVNQETQAGDYDDDDSSGDEAELPGVPKPKVPFCSFPWLLSDVLGKTAVTSNVGQGAKKTEITTIGIARPESSTDNIEALRHLTMDEHVDGGVFRSDDDNSSRLSKGNASSQNSVVDFDLATKDEDAIDDDLTQRGFVSSGVLGDPALMSAEEKAALFADDDDL